MSATKQPKIVGYMASLYDIMTQQAAELNAQDGEGLLIWQGRLIETCNRVGIPTGYYKKVVDALRGLGCIEMITRGTRGSTLTAFMLRYPPTREAYDEAIVKSGWQGLTEAASLDTIASQVKDIQARLGGINWLAIMKDYEERITKLETAVADFQQQAQDQSNKQ